MSEIMELIGSEDQRELDAVDEAADVKRRPGRPRKIIVEGVQPLTGKPNFVHRDEPIEKPKPAKTAKKGREKTGAPALLREIVDAWVRDGGLSREVDAWIAAGATEETVARVRQVLELMEAIR